MRKAVLLTLALALASCGEDPGSSSETPSNDEGTENVDSASLLAGQNLYEEYCSSCHGSLSASTKRGKSAADIKNAIADRADMRSLSHLTDEEIESIAVALNN